MADHEGECRLWWRCWDSERVRLLVVLVLVLVLGLDEREKMERNGKRERKECGICKLNDADD